MTVELSAAIDAISRRRDEKQVEYENYRSYMEIRLREEDLHGCWDAAVNMSEVSNYIEALEYALRAMSEVA
jgi:hypothetical protein